MGKHSKRDHKVEKDGKKRKREETASRVPAQEEGAPFLFGGKTSSDLDDVFGKSATFALPVARTTSVISAQPLASSSLAPVVPQQADASASPAVSKKAKKATKAKKGKQHIAVEPSNDAKESEDEQETQGSQPVASTSAGRDAVEDNLQDSDEADGSELDLMHESLKPGYKKGKEKASKVKYVPPGETSAYRDRRTVFIGNLPIEVAKSKSALHQLRSHILAFAPSAKIESVRFRSVPLATPTEALPGEDSEKDANKREKREKERVAAWRAQRDALEAGGRAAEEADNAQTFIDSKGKRKVAFIKKDFHSELTSCNAYLVFAHPHPDRSAKVAPILDPYEAASKVLEANGSTFMERTIRVDSLRLPSAVALQTATNALSKRDAWLPAGTDPKKSLFVGGLDYAAKEEDVRVFFEELVKKERGEPETRWVTGVRIVRDKGTQLGKGFGYVHFFDRESADEIIAMNSAKLKFAKKPLRVQPCKTLPPTISSRSTQPSSKPAADKLAKPKPSATVKPSAMPRGDPALGEKLKDLSKEERRLAKMSDSDRQARRLAKKKMRHTMKGVQEKGAVKLTASRGEKERGKRVVKAKKGRVRSSNALAKMKGSRV